MPIFLSALWAQVQAWFHRFRWIIWIVIGVCAVIMLFVLRSLVLKKGGGDSGGLLPPIPKPIQDKVDQALEDNLKVRVEATTKADDQKQQLADVLKIDDGAERRKRLAEMLSKT